MDITAPSPATPVKKKGTRKRLLLIAAAVILLIGAVWGIHYWFFGRFEETTDDAYLQADNAVISPKVSGTVVELHVTDNQLVKAGDLLLHIDDRDYKARVAQSEAVVLSAQADLANADAQIERQAAVIAQSEAQVTAADAQAQFQQADAKRYAKLVAEGAASQQAMQKSRTESTSGNASVAEARAALETARKQLDVLKADREKAAASIEHAKAVLTQDKINLENTVIVAPMDGAIGDRSVRLGEFVQTGARLMTVVPIQSVYLIANYKETQVSQMYRGASVTITVDSYPGVTFTGKVDSLAPGTGAQFALLPPENATGNFTKIVQRVPVKIVFDRDKKEVENLRPGLSVTAKVNIRTEAGAPHETLVRAGVNGKSS